MKTIDKTVYRESFNRYTRTFIKSAWNGTEFYPPLEHKGCYDAFSDRRWKRTKFGDDENDGWLDILMQEQDSRCCYCMRRMTHNEVSVEHLIPESFTNLDKADELAFYYEKVPWLSSVVADSEAVGGVLATDPTAIDTISAMPHLIAHSNLFAACNCQYGCSCNNHRGNHRILPMMLMDGVESWVKYNPDGRVVILYEDPQLVLDTLKHLDLNCQTLINIRHLWYLFAQQGVHPDVNKKYTFVEKDMLLRTALGLDTTDVIPVKYGCFLKEAPSDYYWDLLLKYDWFGGIYS